eukprot:scpid104191/ scgid3021/ 
MANRSRYSHDDTTASGGPKSHNSKVQQGGHQDDMRGLKSSSRTASTSVASRGRVRTGQPVIPSQNLTYTDTHLQPAWQETSFSPQAGISPQPHPRGPADNHTRERGQAPVRSSAMATPKETKSTWQQEAERQVFDTQVQGLNTSPATAGQPPGKFTSHQAQTPTGRQAAQTSGMTSVTPKVHNSYASAVSSPSDPDSIPATVAGTAAAVGGGFGGSSAGFGGAGSGGSG